MRRLLLVMPVAAVTTMVVVTLALCDKPARAVASEAAEKSSVTPLRYGHEAAPKPEKSEPQPEPRPSSKPATNPNARQSTSSATHQGPRPTPTKEQLATANKSRHYDLPPGAIMSLTIRAIGVVDAPVFDSDSQWALTNGVGHAPETSLPWSDAPQRNVYLEGHRLGWPGTGSYLLFYHLNWLKKGDEVLLKDREGNSYRYRVSEVMEVNPSDAWVMGQVRGRDMVTLQTCTPIPTFEKRLIVRADRV